MDHENLFYGYDQIICSSPCNRIVPSEIRGIPIPLDYRNFITRYNGAHLIYDRASIDLDEVHVVLFSLEEIISGERACLQVPGSGFPISNVFSARSTLCAR